MIQIPVICFWLTEERCQPCDTTVDMGENQNALYNQWKSILATLNEEVRSFCLKMSCYGVRLWLWLCCLWNGFSYSYKTVANVGMQKCVTFEKQFPEHISFHHKVRPSPGKALLFVRSDRHLILCGMSLPAGSGYRSVFFLIINFGLFQILLLF